LAAEEVSEKISGLEKNTKQLVLSVARNAKFHSSRVETDQFIAKNAIEKRKDSKNSIS
jgi:hypothetical protein